MDSKMSVVKALLVSLGMVDLGLSYILFTHQQYFSLAATLGIFALTALSFLIMTATWAVKRMDRVPALAAAAAASALLISYEALFDITPLSTFLAIAYSVVFISAAALVSALSFYSVSSAIRKLKGARSYLTALLVVGIVSILAFTIMYVVNKVYLPIVDEVAYTYYASYLFVHGLNPYIVGMANINSLYGLVPTPLLNGNYENLYGYLALSFISLSFVPLLNLKLLSVGTAQSFTVYTALDTFLSVFISFMLYYKSNFDRKALLVSGVWLFIAFGVISNTIQSLALLLVTAAYIERHRHALSAVLLGLGASITQLVWFLLPFFYVLALRESGRKVALKEIGVSLLAFLLVNGYYMIYSTYGFFDGVLGLLGLHPVAFCGADIVQFAVAFYSLPYWYSAFASAAVYLFMLLMFYEYSDSLKPMLAVATMAVFLFAWRNLNEYGVTVLPVVIAVYFCGNRQDKSAKDALKSRKPLLYGAVALAALLLLVAVYAHGAYVATKGIAINGIMPRISVQYASGGGMFFGLIGFNANISNNEAEARNISFFIVGRNPNSAGFVLGKNLMTLEPDSSYTYAVNYSMPLVGNSTRLFIVAMTNDYMVSRSINLTIRLPKGAIGSNAPV